MNDCIELQSKILARSQRILTYIDNYIDQAGPVQSEHLDETIIQQLAESIDDPQRDQLSHV